MKRNKPLVSRSKLEQRKPLPKVREKARRSEGRVQHGRIRVRQIKPNTDQQRFWDSLPNECQACGSLGQVIHHILANAPGKTSRRDHFLVVKLCAKCHNIGDISVHALGSEARFEDETGVDLVAAALANREAWVAAHG